MHILLNLKAIYILIHKINLYHLHQLHINMQIVILQQCEGMTPTLQQAIQGVATPVPPIANNICTITVNSQILIVILSFYQDFRYTKELTFIQELIYQ